MENVVDNSVLLSCCQLSETQTFTIHYHVSMPPVNQSEGLLRLEAAEATRPWRKIVNGDQIAVEAP